MFCWVYYLCKNRYFKLCTFSSSWTLFFPFIQNCFYKCLWISFFQEVLATSPTFFQTSLLFTTILQTFCFSYLETSAIIEYLYLVLSSQKCFLLTFDFLMPSCHSGLRSYVTFSKKLPLYHSVMLPLSI
jgi:hypothetical protein